VFGKLLKMKEMTTVSARVISGVLSL